MVDEDHSRLREIWRSMRKRCNNPKCKDYPKYGGRGIKVCTEWNEDFDAFKAWALTHGYKPDLTLERVAVNRGYSPGNCKWISRKAQAYNRRTNTRYEIDGRIRTLTEWSHEYGVPDFTIIHRMQAGWTVKEAITIPVGVKRKER